MPSFLSLRSLTLMTPLNSNAENVCVAAASSAASFSFIIIIILHPGAVRDGTYFSHDCLLDVPAPQRMRVSERETQSECKGGRERGRETETHTLILAARRRERRGRNISWSRVHVRTRACPERLPCDVNTFQLAPEPEAAAAATSPGK